MRRRARNALVLGVAALFLTTATGCFGRFKLVNAVYDFNKGVGHPVAETLVMWGLLIIPVYAIAALGDVLIFNVIEFYGGGGGDGGAVAKTEKLKDGSEVQITRVDADTLRIRHIDATGKVQSVEIVKVGDKAGYVRHADGRIVGTVEQLPDGRLVTATP